MTVWIVRRERKNEMKVSETVKNIVKKKKKACIITGILAIAVVGGVCFFRVMKKR